ncbi:hypothetical protein PR048_020764 [Dryococelus australis]|uniref:HTH psq-type domain-containing protein n=1 Tax=Dryococelus australis TaxID=614101 RepID=A0ABQ9GWB3_9NEOP|nr:hypothetical protein PR048_020764 [Dryococelus australis]
MHPERETPMYQHIVFPKSVLPKWSVHHTVHRCVQNEAQETWQQCAVDVTGDMASETLLFSRLGFCVLVLRTVNVQFVVMSLSKPARAIYKSLTLSEKIAVVKEVEKGLKKKSEIAKDCGILPNTLSTFRKNKD